MASVSNMGSPVGFAGMQWDLRGLAGESTMLTGIEAKRPYGSGVLDEVTAAKVATAMNGTRFKLERPAGRPARIVWDRDSKGAPLDPDGHVAVAALNDLLAVLAKHGVKASGYAMVAPLDGAGAPGAPYCLIGVDPSKVYTPCRALVMSKSDVYFRNGSKVHRAAGGWGDPASAPTKSDKPTGLKLSNAVHQAGVEIEAQLEGPRSAIGVAMHSVPMPDDVPVSGTPASQQDGDSIFDDSAAPTQPQGRGPNAQQGNGRRPRRIAAPQSGSNAGERSDMLDFLDGGEGDGNMGGIAVDSLGLDDEDETIGVPRPQDQSEAEDEFNGMLDDPFASEAPMRRPGRRGRLSDLMDAVGMDDDEDGTVMIGGVDEDSMDDEEPAPEPEPVLKRHRLRRHTPKRTSDEEPHAEETPAPEPADEPAPTQPDEPLPAEEPAAPEPTEPEPAAEEKEPEQPEAPAEKPEEPEADNNDEQADDAAPDDVDEKGKEPMAQPNADDAKKKTSRKTALSQVLDFSGTREAIEKDRRERLAKAVSSIDEALRQGSSSATSVVQIRPILNAGNLFPSDRKLIIDSLRNSGFHLINDDAAVDLAYVDEDEDTK